MTTEKKERFTPQEIDHICYVIGEWYLMNKNRDLNSTIGRAKEELKKMICDTKIGKFHEGYINDGFAVRGSTNSNPLSINDQDYSNQYELIQALYGTVWVYTDNWMIEIPGEKNVQKERIEND